MSGIRGAGDSSGNRGMGLAEKLALLLMGATLGGALMYGLYNGPMTTTTTTNTPGVTSFTIDSLISGGTPYYRLFDNTNQSTLEVSTNMSQIIQDAIGTGNVNIYIAAGTYIINTQIYVTQNNVTISGAGQATVLDGNCSASPTVVATIVVNGTLAKPVFGFHISNLVIDDHLRSHTGVDGFTWNYVQDSSIDYLTIKNIGEEGMELGAVTRVRVFGCDISKCNLAGYGAACIEIAPDNSNYNISGSEPAPYAYENRSSDCSVMSCTAHDSNGIGILLRDTEDCKAVGNTVTNTLGGICIQAWTGYNRNSLVSNNIIANSTSYGILYSTQWNSGNYNCAGVVDSNVIVSSASEGIGVVEAYQPQVTNNYADGSKSLGGIYLNRVYYGCINNNHVCNTNGAGGIQCISDVYNCTFDNNICSNLQIAATQTDGILFKAACANNQLSNNFCRNNIQYGINMNATTDKNNVVIYNMLLDNALGTVNYTGTTNVIIGNSDSHSTDWIVKGS